MSQNQNMFASDISVSGESESELEEKRFERRDSEVKEMIRVIEERHVRLLNSKNEIRRGRVPVSRHKSQRYNREFKTCKSQLLVNTEPNLSISQPSLVALARFNSEGAQSLQSSNEEENTDTESEKLNPTSEVQPKFITTMIQK